jgi:hypothetical protein
MNQEEQQQHLSDLNHKIEKIFRDLSHRTHHSELYDNRIQVCNILIPFHSDNKLDTNEQH